MRRKIETKYNEQLSYRENKLKTLKYMESLSLNHDKVLEKKI